MANIVWHREKVDKSKREQLLNQSGKVIWLTGLSGSGKSTIGNSLEEELHKLGKLTYLLDGDNLRFGLNSDLGFSVEDRTENIRRVREVSKLLLNTGSIIIGTFVSPIRADRDKLREELGEDFIEIYISCDIDSCKERDPKGLYRKALNGEIKDFTGIDSVYEEPESPELIVDTTKKTVEESTQAIIEYLKGRGVI